MVQRKNRNYLLLKVITVCAFFLVFNCALIAQVKQAPRFQSESLKHTNLIIYASFSGQKIFNESQYKNDFWPLSRYFVTQKNLTFCAIASAVMVLNALNIRAPFDKTYSPYRIFTQHNIFTPKVKRVIDISSLYKEGLTLDQFENLMRQFPVHIKTFHANHLSLARFRRIAIHALQSKNTFIVVNLDRHLYGTSGGHFSPIAAYDQQTDRFLIMDVARYRFPPVWAKADDLFKAMDTIDTANHQRRGFAIITPQ
jgi:hypothetical protein